MKVYRVRVDINPDTWTKTGRSRNYVVCVGNRNRVPDGITEMAINSTILDTFDDGVEYTGLEMVVCANSRSAAYGMVFKRFKRDYFRKLV